MSERILVATDGRPQSAGALRLAARLAERGVGEVEVLTVHEPPPLYPQAFNAPVPDLAMDHDLMRSQTRAVREQVREVAGEVAWPVRAWTGAPAPVIAARAQEGGFHRILVGIGRHRPVDRWLGGETALRVAQVAHVPVLAVHPEARELPRRALVAVDFSDLSTRAARACLPLLADGAELHLIHVTWMGDDGGAPGPEWMTTYAAGARARLEELADALRREGRASVRTHLLAAGLGDRAGDVLLAAAAREGAELVAAGSHGLGFLGRLLMGSVSTRLLRGAHCSVLVAPPSAAAPELERVPAAGVPLPVP